MIVMDNNLVSSNLTTIIFFIGFYQLLLSPLTIFIIILSIWINIIIHLLIKNDIRIHNNYITYITISLLTILFISVYSLGGIFALNIQYLFSLKYFYSIDNTNLIPYFTLSCIFVILIFIPLIYHMTTYNMIHYWFI